MSISKQITLRCEVCLCHSDDLHWTAREAREVAREDRWRRRIMDGRLLDVCPAYDDTAVAGLPPEELPGSRFYEAGASLFLGTPTGRIIELSLSRDDAGSSVYP